VFTDRSLGPALDLGASWLEGDRGNPITTLAREFGLSYSRTDWDSGQYWDFDGVEIPDAEVTSAEQRFETLLDRGLAIAEDLDDDIAVAEALRRASANESFTARARRGYDWMRAEQEVELGSDLEDLSAWWGDDGEEFGGEQHVWPEGYGQVPAGLARGLDVRLGHRVTRVAYDGRGVVVTTDRGELRAQRVLVTLPIGVLRAGDVEFAPALPADKRASIERLGIGLLNKVALQFERAFWPVETHIFYHWPERYGAYPEWVNWRRYTDHAVLIALTGGAFAVRQNGQSETAIVDEAMATLRTMFGRAVPDPTGFRIARWGLDPLAKCAYSYLRVGGEPADRQRLAAPLTGRVFFAGEATHGEYPATVHGAYLSGVREAERIAALR
jgi:monoamine oxidase